MGANFAKRPEYKSSSTQSGNFSTVSLSAQLVTDLSSAPAYSFANWPNPSIPTFGAGVYTIWNNDGRFIYVGMSGRGITAETNRRNTPRGIYTRLQSHASGRRSGDQFCVYVADLLPTCNVTVTSTASRLISRRCLQKIGPHLLASAMRRSAPTCKNAGRPSTTTAEPL
jgi:hypothetical protein